jgi:hypothetical protein
MRIYKNCGPYYGRQPERRQQMLDEVLRQPAPKPSGGNFPSAPRAGRGDVKDSYLRGRGENLFSEAHYSPSKKK